MINDKKPLVKRCHFDCLPSTQDYAKAHQVNMGPGVWSLVTSDCQTQGYGTHQRLWFSPPNVNIYATFSKWVPKETLTRLIHIPQVTALSLVQTVRVLYPMLSPKIKWINDIFLNGKKVGGILSETNPLPGDMSEAKTYTVLHVGIGLNVNMSSIAQNALGQPITSLALEMGEKAHAAGIDKETILAQLSDRLPFHLDRCLTEGIMPFYDQMNALMAFKGEEVQFAPDEPGQPAIVCGKLEGINTEGALLLSIPGQGVQSFSRGRLLTRSLGY